MELTNEANEKLDFFDKDKDLNSKHSKIGRIQTTDIFVEKVSIVPILSNPTFQIK